jgi:hypothetical protein
MKSAELESFAAECAKCMQKVCMKVVDPQKKSAKKSAESVHFKKKCLQKVSKKSSPDADFADSCRLLKKSTQVCPHMYVRPEREHKVDQS